MLIDYKHIINNNPKKGDYSGKLYKIESNLIPLIKANLNTQKYDHSQPVRILTKVIA